MSATSTARLPLLHVSPPPILVLRPVGFVRAVALHRTLLPLRPRSQQRQRPQLHRSYHQNYPSDQKGVVPSASSQLLARSDCPSSSFSSSSSFLDLDANIILYRSLLNAVMTHVKRHLAAEAARSDAQLSALCSTVTHLKTSVSKLAFYVKDLRRTGRSSDIAVESLHLEVPQGRGILQRLDGWVHD